MTDGLKRKAFIGIWRFLFPLPTALVNHDVTGFANAVCRRNRTLSEEERRVHHFVVSTMADTNEAVSAQMISEKLDISLEKVLSIIEKLEGLKVYFYRYENPAINWAYPVTTDDNLYDMTFSSGKKFNAA